MTNSSFISTIATSYWEEWFEACYEQMQDQILKAKGDVWIQMNSMFFSWIFMEKGVMVNVEGQFYHAKMLGCSVRNAGKHTSYLFSVIDFGGL